MKNIFTKLLQISNGLSGNKKIFMIDLLDQLSNKITRIIAANDSYKRQLTGINPKQYNETLEKSIAILKLLGFSELTFESFNSNFLNWVIENTVTNGNYNPKLMNYYMLDSLQQSYMICFTSNNGKEPTYKQVKENLLTWADQIKESEKTLKLSIPELINKIDGKY